MAKCERPETVFRPWPALSRAVLRRKLLEVVICGVSCHRRPAAEADNSDFGSSTEPDPSVSSRRRKSSGSERLAELLRAEAAESRSEEEEAEAKKSKIEALERLQSVVRSLQSSDLRRSAAADARLLAKDDPTARETLAMLGAIPPLVSALDSGDSELQIDSLYALLNLAIGNDLNKAAIVKAGAIHKMMNLIESENPSISLSEAIAANFLGLSALDSNKPIIGAAGAIPFLVKSFQNPNPNQARHDALRSLVNLSISPSNIPLLIDADVVPTLLAAIGDMAVSERALTVLSNVIGSAEGRRAVTRSPDSVPILSDVLIWADSPECQEKAAYVLMVAAHKASHGERTAMIESGIVSPLLELALVGSALAQKRAARILEILGIGKGKRAESAAPPVSAPLCDGGGAAGLGEGREEEEGALSEERRAVRKLVEQSLQSNMRRIVRRANLPEGFAPSDRLRAIAGGGATSSKSVPLF